MADDVFDEWDGKKPKGSGKPGRGKKNGADPRAVTSIRSSIEAAEPAPEGGGCTMPPGFEMRDDGLYYQPFDDRKFPFKVSGPFKVLAESRPEDNAEWGLLLGWHDRDRNWHEWIMPRRLLAGDAVEVRARLAAGALDLGLHPEARQQLVNFLAAVRIAARVRTVSRAGWYRPAAGPPAFVLGARTIGHVQGEAVRLDIDPAPAIYRAAGTAEGWREEIAALCVGNSRLIFIVSAAFAAPLIGLLGDEGGGLHLRGASSRGKTTLLDSAASVYGAPTKCGPHSFAGGWNTTNSALEATAAAHNDLPLPMDEISEADPVKLPGKLYMLSNGTGRERAQAGGGNRPHVTWRTLVLSSGEESAARAVQQLGRHVKAGTEVRMLDVPAEVAGGHGVFEDLHGAADGAAFQAQLRAATLRQHGTAGVAFLERLVARLRQDPDFAAAEIAPKVRRWTAAILPPGADGQVQRAARRLALIAAGGELATEFGVTGWQAGTASAAVAAVFRDWLAERGGIGSREDFHLFAALRRFIGRASAVAIRSDQGQDRGGTGCRGAGRAAAAGRSTPCQSRRLALAGSERRGRARLGLWHFAGDLRCRDCGAARHGDARCARAAARRRSDPRRRRRRQTSLHAEAEAHRRDAAADDRRQAERVGR